MIFPMQFIPKDYESKETWGDIRQSSFCSNLIQAYNSDVGKKLVREGLSQIKGQTSQVDAEALPIRSVDDDPSDTCIGRSVLIRYMANFEYLDHRNRNQKKKLEVIKASRYFEKDFRKFVERHGFSIVVALDVETNIKAFMIKFVGPETVPNNSGDST